MTRATLAEGMNSYARSRPRGEHSVNEDAYVADDRLGLYVVCDGIGGRAGGEIASTLACEGIRQAVANFRFDEGELPGAVLERALRTACRAVYERGSRDPGLSGMGTTATAIFVRGAVAYLAHVGDSRAYLIRKGETVQLTRDHSVAAELVAQGVLKPSDQERSPYSRALTRALGITDSVVVDTLVIELLPDDVLLLCSDGAAPGVSGAGGGMNSADFARATDAILSRAAEAGRNDDATVVLVKIPEIPDRRRTEQTSLTFEVLTDTELFRDLTLPELMKVTAETDVVTVPAGRCLIAAGDGGTDLYVILEGTAEVRLPSGASSVLGPGTQVGELALLSGDPRSANVLASTEILALRMSQRSFHAVASQDPLIGMKLFRSLAQTLADRLRAHATQGG